MKSSPIKFFWLVVLSLILTAGNVLAQQKPARLPALAQQVADSQEQVRKLQQSNDELRSRLQYVSLWLGKKCLSQGRICCQVKARLAAGLKPDHKLPSID
jgi:hypothetical protein